MENKERPAPSRKDAAEKSFLVKNELEEMTVDNACAQHGCH
jgi:hypothetical protein